MRPSGSAAVRAVPGVVEASTHGSDLGFTGRQNDGTGLMYYRDRYYSPTLQRFISEDPIGLAGGSNLYGYAADSPTNLTDPSGDDPFVGCAIGALLGGGIDYAGQRLLGRKVDWGWSGVGGAAGEGCLFGAIGGLSGRRRGGRRRELDPFARGFAIEERLGGNLPAGFRNIDKVRQRHGHQYQIDRSERQVVPRG